MSGLLRFRGGGEQAIIIGVLATWLAQAILALLITASVSPFLTSGCVNVGGGTFPSLSTNFIDSTIFITSDDSLIDYDPILPGQTSPFKVITTYNPAMSSAKIDFKYLFGGTIKWITKAP